MDVYYPINVIMLAVSAWALWVRRDAWRSAWDRPMNISIILQAIGTVLTSRAPGVRSALVAFFGREFVWLSGAAAYAAALVFAIFAVYKRLLSDQGIGPFMTTRVLWPVAAAWAVMIPAFLLSASLRRSDPGRFLYAMAARDPWLTLYQAVYLMAMLYLLILVERGMAKLRDQVPDSFDTAYLLWAWVGILTVVVQMVGLFVDVSIGFKYGWPLADLAGALMALGAGWSWLKRTRSAVRPPHPG